MAHPDTRQHQEGTLRVTGRGILAGTVATGLATTGLFIAAKHGHDSYETNHAASYHSAQEDAVRAINGFRESTFTFTPQAGGTPIKVRFTPETQNGSLEDDLPNNVALTVKPGKELIAQGGLTSDTYPGWVAITAPGVAPADIDSLADRAASTYWLNVAELKQEGVVEVTPQRFHGYPQADQWPAGTSFTAQISPDESGQSGGDVTAKYLGDINDILTSRVQDTE